MDTLRAFNDKVNERIFSGSIVEINTKIIEVKDSGYNVYLAHSHMHLTALVGKIRMDLVEAVFTDLPKSRFNNNITVFNYEELEGEEFVGKKPYILFLEAAPFGFVSEGYQHAIYKHKLNLERQFSDVVVDIDFYDGLVLKNLNEGFELDVKSVYIDRKPLASIVVLSGLGNDVVLSRMLEGLVNHTRELHESLEFIVVLNGCPDYSSVYASSQLRGLNFKIINLNENMGIAGGFNAGIDAADTEFVFMLQDDIKINDDQFIARYLKLMKGDNQIGLIGGYSGARLHLNPDYPEVNNTKCFDVEPVRVKEGESVEVDEVLCHAMCYRKSVNARFDLLFNPNGLEDIDFSFNVRQKGYKVLLSPIKMDNLRSDGVTRKFINPLITRKFHYNYFYKKHSNLLKLK